MKAYMIDHFSAVNQYSVELSEELGKRIDLTVLTVNDSIIEGSHSFKYKKILYGHYEKSEMAKRVIYLCKLIRLSTEIILNRPDVVHIQTFGKYNVEVKLYRALKPFVGKYVYTSHNVAPHEQKAEKSPYHEIMDLADTIIVHNEVCKDILVNDNGIDPSKIAVIAHGAYSLTIKDRKIVCLREDKKEKVELLQFGLIRKYKGIKTLLEALNLLPESYKNKLHVIIAGKQDSKLDDTDYRGIIDNYGLDSVVSFRPERIPDSDMISMFENADACVCPYVNIYGSGALLMAYTFDVPVIASDIPAFREETDNGKTGFLFRPEDAEDLASKIIEFIDFNPDAIQRKKDEINRLVSEKYSWTKSADCTLDVYKK